MTALAAQRRMTLVGFSDNKRIFRHGLRDDE